ncbi:hypothetical protein E4U55_001196 [Claviceps digitariae]|nr:hypothetical protein E4U55_001196 [Claviceps digitariae]
MSACGQVGPVLPTVTRWSGPFATRAGFRLPTEDASNFEQVEDVRSQMETKWIVAIYFIAGQAGITSSPGICQPTKSSLDNTPSGHSLNCITSPGIPTAYPQSGVQKHPVFEVPAKQLPR